MVRVSIAIAAVIAASAACGADTATRETVQHVAEASAQPAAIRLPENPLDRGIRRELNLAVAQDGELKQREISFNVVNGDVSVVGAVRSEDERKKINEIVMNIAGVKSVANALRIAE
jgi:osmotically-inducible protein OsmY